MLTTHFPAVNMECSQCHDLRVYLCLPQRSACASVMNVTRLNILGGSVWWSTVCFGVWDRIFTCCLGDIQIFQLQAQPIACFTTAVIHPIYCEMMFLLSACKTRVEASLLIVVFGLQPAAFSFFFWSLSPVEHQCQCRDGAGLEAEITLCSKP